MAKLSRMAPAGPTSAIKSGPAYGETTTYEGAKAYVRDAKGELFSLAVTNLVSEETFYEGAKDRDARFAALVHQVTAEDPEWMQGFIPYLRTDMRMRSASIVAACEYVAAGGPHGRAVLTSAMERADEPGEALGYWLATRGRPLPKPIKRGIADGARKLYNQRSLLKYDGQRQAVRFGDVIDMTHPQPLTPEQAALFRHALDRRHNRADAVPGELGMVALAARLEATPEDNRRELLSSDALRAAGFTWERLGGWLPGGMDAEAWEAVIPEMGVMALLRNLRNFDDAKISKAAQRTVMDKITSREDIVASKVLPFRFLSAWQHAAMVWGPALEEGCQAALANVPVLSGSTLVLCDVSGSMGAVLSSRSTVARHQVGALMGATCAVVNTDSTLVAFADRTKRVDVEGKSALRTALEIGRMNRVVGNGTEFFKALRETYRESYDRVICFTDMQFFGERAGWYYENEDTSYVRCPIYVVDLAGYRAVPFQFGQDNRHQLAGFSENLFLALKLLEDRNRQGWPWA